MEVLLFPHARLPFSMAASRDNVPSTEVLTLSKVTFVFRNKLHRTHLSVVNSSHTFQKSRNDEVAETR
jgi:hypothetical protein